MNSDLYDSAAWRTFHMLDAEESATFDEAMRHDPDLRSAYHEMDRLCAAIAAVTAMPVEPKAAQLERVQSRLGMKVVHPPRNWQAITGWATAAILAVLLTLDVTGRIEWIRPRTVTPSATIAAQRASTSAEAPAAGKDADGKLPAKVEAKRLNQEIAVLRNNLETFEHSDRVLFEVVPGMALPVVMAMNPPDIPLDDAATTKNEEHSPLTTLLGDALRALTTTPSEVETTATSATDAGWLSKHTTAIPIYDAARDSGTLVVSNLPPAADGEAYNLWVTTEAGTRPIYVGTLPADSAAGTTSFDFSLGSTMVLPSGFLLTKDPQNAPALPSESNTILQGPPTPPR